MPWIYRSRSRGRTKFKARFRRWAFDHSSVVVELEVGAIVVSSFLLFALLASKFV